MYLTLGSGPRITTHNTEILITTIGEDANSGLPSLICHTDLTTCCRNLDNNGMGPLGQWTFPDGSVILNEGGSTKQFYINRNTPQLIRLNRRVTNPLTPTGSYCCTVPTTGGETTLCANLGEWIVQWSPYPTSPSHSGVPVSLSTHQWRDLLLRPNTGSEHCGHLHLCHWLHFQWRHYQDLWE